jgi:hypothetical protein
MIGVPQILVDAKPDRMSINRRSFAAGTVATLACTPTVTTVGALLSPPEPDVLHFGYVDRLRFWQLYRVHLPPNPVARDMVQRLIADAEHHSPRTAASTAEKSGAAS